MARGVWLTPSPTLPASVEGRGVWRFASGVLRLAIGYGLSAISVRPPCRPYTRSGTTTDKYPLSSTACTRLGLVGPESESFTPPSMGPRASMRYWAL